MKNLISSFSLLEALVVREFKGRYRRSVFGPLWAVIQPLVYMGIFIFVGFILKIKAPEGPYVVYLCAALVPWTFFANAVTRCASSLVNNASLVKKTAVPREIFPLSVVIVSLIDFAISFVILLLLLVLYRMPLHITLLWVPVLTLLVFAFSTTLGLALAAIGTYRNDVMFAVPLLLQAWMFATPIFYPANIVPKSFVPYYNLNPMVGIIQGFRASIINGDNPDLSLLGLTALSVLALGLVTRPLFRSVSQYFADVL